MAPSVTANAELESTAKPGYYGCLDEQQVKTLSDFKTMLAKRHGISAEASPIEERFRVNSYADPAVCYDLELL